MSDDLATWVEAAGRELGLALADVPTDVVLDLAREVAHGVVRPAAPVTAFLMGLAVGRGADPDEVAGRLSELARSWAPPPS
jgi:hypothetical protein